MKDSERVFHDRFGWKFLGSRTRYANNFSEQQWFAMLAEEYANGHHEGSPDGRWKIVNHLGVACLVRFGGPGVSLGSFQISQIRF